MTLIKISLNLRADEVLLQSICHHLTHYSAIHNSCCELIWFCSGFNIIRVSEKTIEYDKLECKIYNGTCLSKSFLGEMCFP